MLKDKNLKKKKKKELGQKKKKDAEKRENYKDQKGKENG